MNLAERVLFDLVFPSEMLVQVSCDSKNGLTVVSKFEVGPQEAFAVMTAAILMLRDVVREDESLHPTAVTLLGNAQRAFEGALRN